VHWREQGLKLKPVTINFSAKQMEDSDFADYLEHLLKKHELSPNLIEQLYDQNFEQLMDPLDPSMKR
jgi:EAL domain-containing protein (putative c-di-GMP-specific phosphodiesterase class I)